MLGFIKKDQQNSALTERVRGWTRQRFELSDDETVMVSEIACQVPGCPPIETHVVFWTAAGRHHFKIFKPLAAVSEFTVINDNFSAEFGNGTSVLNLITKSGTNRFHGSAFEFVQNDVLDARYTFSQQRDKLRYNQFGGTLGGPIRKDKLFFFFSYQNTLNPNSSSGVVTVPTQAAKNGDLSAYGVTIGQQRLLVLVGAVTRPAASAEPGEDGLGSRELDGVA